MISIGDFFIYVLLAMAMSIAVILSTWMMEGLRDLAIYLLGRIRRPPDPELGNNLETAQPPRLGGADQNQQRVLPGGLVVPLRTEIPVFEIVILDILD